MFKSCYSILLVILMTSNAIAQESNEQLTYSIAIHGGAGSSPDMFSDEANQSRHDSMEQALEIGQKILVNDGTSLEAVEAVIRFLEDDPHFNAGKGAVFNAEGEHELDASIMDGSNLACGAIAGVRTIKNPISLARLVMTETPHVLLAGPGADEFGELQQVELVEPDYFDTPATKKRWNEFLQERDNGNGKGAARQLQLLDLDTGSYMGTVGCVALDSHGNLAAGTSTGGMTNKQFGRVGDSPIVAAGTWASNETCAVSCTGIGEEFIRRAVAFDVAARIKYQGVTVEEAVREILTSELPAAAGGIIALDQNGSISMQYSTGGMARAAADSSGRFEVIWHEQPAASDN
ncbi:MAG: isoaspartyl peptidase/L-asparaginase family protein [Pirellulaceae bacterium]